MEQYKYDAFISYRHLPLDKAVAEKLQALLESYRPPKGIDRARVKGRVFRDQSELPTTGDLNADILEALRQSRFLVVVCSEDTKGSKWCMREIEYFKALHGGKCFNILTVLVSADPREAFPAPLCHETQGDGEVDIEPLAANVYAGTKEKSLRLLKTEFLRIAAPMLGCGYDDLFRRHQRRLVRRAVQVGCAALLAAAAVGTYVVYNQFRIAEQQGITQNEKAMRTLKAAEGLINSGDRVMASAVLLDLLDNSRSLGDYTRSEIERLLYQSTYVPQFTQYAALGHKEAIACAAFGDDDVLYVAAEDRTITVWDARSGAQLREVKTEGRVAAMLLEGDLLYAVTRSQQLIIWDTRTWEVVDTFSIGDDTNPEEYVIIDMMLSGDYLLIAEEDYDRVLVRAVDLNKREGWRAYQDPDEPDYYWLTFSECIFDKANSRVILFDADSTYKDMYQRMYQAGALMLVHDLKTDKKSGFALPEGAQEFAYIEETGCILCLCETYGEKDFEIYLLGTTGEVAGHFYSSDKGRAISMISMREWLSVAAVSPDGKYAALWDTAGHVTALDLEDLTITNWIATGGDVSSVTFIDEKYLLISSWDTNRPAKMCRYDEWSEETFVVVNEANQRGAIFNKDRSVMAVFDGQVQISLFNMGRALNERLSNAAEEELFGTDVPENGCVVQEGEYKVNAVSSDGKYRLITILTEELPAHIVNQGNGDWCSCWLVDNETDERLFNTNIPKDFVAIDIKDGQTATLLTSSNFVYTFDMTTGSIDNSFRLPQAYADFSAIVKLRVDYEKKRLFIARSVGLSNDEVETIGGLYSLEDGSLICDYSGLSRTHFLAIDGSFTKIYKYERNVLGHNDASFTETYIYEFDQSKAAQVIEADIPDVPMLIDMARKQAEGRAITDREWAMLGLE